MLGYLEDGKPKIGFVYHAPLERLYYAIHGKGAFLIEKNKEKQQIYCKDSEINEAIACTNFKYEEKIHKIFNILEISKFNKIGSMGNINLKIRFKNL
jgi:fructose-1,6-bisphosphatase/inositol monophosphatase family enzyme